MRRSKAKDWDKYSSWAALINKCKTTVWKEYELITKTARRVAWGSGVVGQFEGRDIK